jgi:undecaprenyl diphosphate synthase
VAFIVDGNGRWAVEQGLPRFEGHSKGANTTVEVAKHLFSSGVSVLTFYLFSTENWSRPPMEVANIMSLLEKYLVDVSAYLLENKIRLNVIGQLDRLPGSSQALIKALEMSTEGFIKDEEGGKTLCLALSYGGRDDIVNACKKINASGLSPDDISEETFNSYLSLGSRDIPDPDLVIRTSGEQRLSNFLLWQSAYSEFVYLDTLWPDLTVDECCKVLREYGSRERRFGGEATIV